MDKTALAKVRKLVDNFERDERALRIQQFRVTAWFVAAILSVMAVAFLIARPSKPEPVTKKRVDPMAECMTQTRAIMRAERESELRRLQPQLPADEIVKRVRAEWHEVAREAEQRCARANAS
ncbi:MAG: hypothetical protein JNM76_01520 [Betaproteobacteria bacterium]|nr:hypothetical protein [Betaproteobacteria bacterium]